MRCTTRRSRCRTACGWFRASSRRCRSPFRHQEAAKTLHGNRGSRPFLDQAP
uniref:Uncharacterized protein n=1 Tax=uncultured marine virus TaxID=186617 RepID=A0A0F7L376_9VIRU|nr:hypothetical protein [uncultured marine virus]